VEIMLKIGDSLLLEPKYSLQPEKYKCKIHEITGNVFYIDYPINLDTNRTVFLTDGTQLKCTYIGSEGNVYIFDTEVLGRKKMELPFVQLRTPAEHQFVKIQRRQYVRIDAAVDVAVHPLNFEFRPFTAITADISAGGAAILVPKTTTIKPGSYINVWIVLPLKSGDIYYLKLKSKVIRIVEQEGSNFNKVSIQFSEISKGDRQLLIRFCFEKQLEMRNKGL
jgi:c-di-GMP-binding flagellar brake protein YcgR